MRRQANKTTFWTILTLTNLLLTIYPASMYFNADGDGAQFLAAILLVSIGLVLAIADAVCVVVAYATS